MLQKASFGYSRKDVLLIGLGVTLLGIGLKSGLEVPFFLLLYNHWNLEDVSHFGFLCNGIEINRATIYSCWIYFAVCRIWSATSRKCGSTGACFGPHGWMDLNIYLQSFKQGNDICTATTWLRKQSDGGKIILTRLPFSCFKHSELIVFWFTTRIASACLLICYLLLLICRNG